LTAVWKEKEKNEEGERKMGRKPKENPARDVVRYAYEVKDVNETPTALREGDAGKYTTGQTFGKLLFQDIVHSTSGALVDGIAEKDPARAQRIHDHFVNYKPNGSFSHPQQKKIEIDSSLILEGLRKNLSPKDFVVTDESSEEEAQRGDDGTFRNTPPGLLDTITSLPYKVKLGGGKEG
jgi:hypothetical protein